MTGWIIGGGIVTVILAAVWLNWRGERAGRADERAKNLDKGIQGLDAARRAVSDSRLDGDRREQLRDKYRARS